MEGNLYAIALKPNVEHVLKGSEDVPQQLRLIVGLRAVGRRA